MPPLERISGFPPVARDDARLLILGSMPGEASLAAGQYYAHPRNAFWPVMRELLGFGSTASYRERTSSLVEHRIALWDVLKTCIRSGSLDSDIDAASVEANDFVAFFAVHAQVDTVWFNGGTAERWYRRLVLPDVGHVPVRYLRLPSTSPAHASVPLEGKVEAWRTALRATEDRPLPAARRLLRGRR